MIFLSPKQLTMRPNQPLVNNSAVAVSRGIILAAGPAEAIIRKYPGQRTMRLKNSILLPGLVNLHTHLELPPLLDAIRAKAFPDWVLNLIKAKMALTSRDYACAAKTNINTLLHTGTTTVGEICTHGISPAYLKKSGLRAFIFHEIINRGLKTKLRNRGRNTGLIQNGLSPHTPYTVSEAILRQIKRSAEKYESKLCMHVAESKDEIRLLQSKENGLEKLYQLAGWDLSSAPRGSSSFEYLQKIGFLSPNLVAVHAVQATGNDIRLISKSNVAIAHCPRSNQVTNVGRMQLRKFLDAGITVGLGTDSLASVPSLNMWDEMRYALQIHRKDGVSAEDIFRLATIGGAKALGLDNKIGTLETGKKADIIAVPLPQKDSGDLYSDLLRETKSSIMTIVDGKILFKKS
jgi:cytosine/adenosine deaminase-related metal-dependent hydrolase